MMISFRGPPHTGISDHIDMKGVFSSENRVFQLTRVIGSTLVSNLCHRSSKDGRFGSEEADSVLVFKEMLVNEK